MNFEEALNRLMDGNQRFISGNRRNVNEDEIARLAALAKSGQNPFAVVLSCSDSRVPAEHVFDCSIGDLFVIRVAGNIIQPSQIASIEYAAHILKCPLLLIMGHTMCGAVQVAYNHVASNTPMATKNIQILADLIKPAVSRVLARAQGKQNSEVLDECVSENVREVANKLMEASPLLKELSHEKKFSIEKAVFNIETGSVRRL